MSEIVWEEPPKIRGRVRDLGKWLGILEPLMEHPERWARVAEKDTQPAAASAAKAFRDGAKFTSNGGKRPPNILLVPSGRWEFVSRTVPDEEMNPHYYVYARYLGEESA